MKKINNRSAVIWFSRLLRWSLAALFISVGFLYLSEGAWPAILVGLVLFVTGFLTPKRCLDEGSCELPR